MKALLILILLLLISCGNTTVSGSSSDVDIITGIAVSSEGARLKNASVIMYDSKQGSEHSDAVDTVFTDSAGRYSFTKVGEGVFNIQASYRDSLFASRMNIEHSADSVTTVSPVTLLAPGVLMGTVQLESNDCFGVDIFIPGTSYFAKSKTDGSFVMTNVPAGSSYVVAYQMAGYAVTTLEGITVAAGDTTRLDVVTLVRNSYPTGVTAVYSAVNGVGTVKISWNPLRSADKIIGYTVYRKDSRKTGLSPVQISGNDLCTDTFYVDTISEELFSSEFQIPLQYHVKAKMANEELTPFSNRAEVTVHSLRDSLMPKSLTFHSPKKGDVFIGETSVSIDWVYKGLIPEVKLDFSLNNGRTWHPIVSNLANCGHYDWIAVNFTSDSCKLRITAENDTAAFQYSEMFSLKEIKNRNLLMNGDFSLGLAKWNLNLHPNEDGSETEGSIRIDSLQQLNFKLGAKPDSLWKVSVSQWGIPLMNGANYRLIFTARSSVPKHQVYFCLGRGSAPWTTYSLVEKLITDTARVDTVEMNMHNASLEDDLSAVFSIDPATSPNAVLYIDNIRLERITD